MKRASNELLSGAGGTVNENCKRGARDAAHDRSNAGDRKGLSEQKGCQATIDRASVVWLGEVAVTGPAIRGCD
jgi:hypothetical protein